MARLFHRLTSYAADRDWTRTVDDPFVVTSFEPNDPDSATAAYEREGRRERCALITGQAAEMAARIINDQR